MNKTTNEKKTKLTITSIGPMIPKDLHPLDERIIKNQATQNLGTLGHVSHGKTTLVEGMTGIKTIRHEMEKKRNITMKLGYANFKIFQCLECDKPECYQSAKSSTKKMECPNYGCGSKMKLIRHFSFVDCPGHEFLMATMLNGASVMDSSLLIVAANQPVPQPQTAEHLAAAQILELKNTLIVQTKLDLVKPEQAKENHEDIRKFVCETIAEKAPVIPVCSTPNSRFNLDVLLQYLVEAIPIPERDFESPPMMKVIRSFNINKPGCDAKAMKGGVLGGSLLCGVLPVGQMVEIRPGRITIDGNGRIRCQPLFTMVVSLMSENNSMEYAVPGGLIAVGTKLDPSLTMGDRMVGQTVGFPGKLPEIYQEIEVRYQLMKRMIGIKEEENQKIKKIFRRRDINVKYLINGYFGTCQSCQKTPVENLLENSILY
eukprot:TRINITY_DN3601_c0_g1_i2.p1 TRINITY_DN3601_c0_g1~~TRINITY_DN3601_c0_g1_i2.p1  ORF type:complete len:429 (+),score=105.05 TRINITY_DN3601_c0_g1_i2:116-1402(+)